MTLLRFFRQARAALKSRVRRIIHFDRTARQDARLLAMANRMLLQAQEQQFGRDIGMRAIALDRDAAGRKTLIYRIPAGVKIRPS